MGSFVEFIFQMRLFALSLPQFFTGRAECIYIYIRSRCDESRVLSLAHSADGRFENANKSR